MRLGRLLTSALTTVVLATTVAPADAVSTTTPTGGQLTVTSNGFGHGRGMSQYGAYGRAQAGQSYSQILAFYYPGTARSRVSGALRVAVSDSARYVTVKPARTLRVHAVGGRTYRVGHRGVAAWRLVPYSVRTAVQYKAHGHWHRYRFVPGVTNEFLSGAGRLTLVTPQGPKPYRGRIRSARGRAVNVVPVDSYVKGVVAAEMPASWSQQALQAQAVAARTYAWSAKVRHAAAAYDICDTTACQVYGGIGSEQSTTDSAVAATAGQVLTYQGSVAFTEFSASNGGWTAASTLDPTPQADPYDTAFHHVAAPLDVSKLKSAYPAVGTITDVSVTSRDNAASTEEWGGRALTVTITGSTGTQVMTGDQVRILYGLKSTWFNLS